MLPNDSARFRRTRQHSASFSSPPSPQPKCRPRSRLLYCHRSVSACALAASFGEGVVAAPPRPRTPQWSALFVGVIRPGAYCPGTDHASPLPVDCYCLGMASVLSIFACSRSSPLRSESLLSSAPPITHARGTGPRGTRSRRRILSEPFPPTPSRHPMREREQAACLQSVLPHSSASSSPARPAPVRITPFYCQPSATAKGSSHRARCVGHGSCRGGLRSVLPASPPAHPITSRYV